MSDNNKKPSGKLGQWLATAICGNDILSSALYVSGIAIIFAGVYAPVVLLFIALVLFLYKSVYTEVVEALPVNGGAYNCLLNGTSKTIAAVAGITTFLSYIATSVISAKTAVEYAHVLIPLPIIPATIAILALFALLVISGIKDSAKVAFSIFVVHVVALSLFLLLGLLFYLKGHSYFLENFKHTQSLLAHKGGLLTSLYLAFSASLLGVSGFESSANFVEEQAPGVFRKTLRNMLIGVAVFNPLIALVVLNSMQFTAIASAKDFLLANAATVLGGPAFQIFIVVDAFLVLAGAVLTSYIGVSGLLSRMAADACVPNIFSLQNKKGSFPVVVVAFFLLCSSILLITRGQLLTLAGVYTIAFLGVMTLFAFGNMILKETRRELRRTYKAPLAIVILAFLATTFGILGNIRIDINNLHFFEVYFIPFFVIVLVIIYQDYIISFLLRFTRTLPFLHKYVNEYFNLITERRFVAFIHHISRTYTILQYIDRNETGRHLTIVHCKCGEGDKECSGIVEIRNTIRNLQAAGAFSHIAVDVLYVNKSFGPETVKDIARDLKIRKNRILIGSIHNFHPYDYASLGGVRIIF